MPDLDRGTANRGVPTRDRSTGRSAPRRARCVHDIPGELILLSSASRSAPVGIKASGRSGELQRRPGPAVQDVSVLVKDAHLAGSTDAYDEEGALLVEPIGPRPMPVDRLNRGHSRAAESACAGHRLASIASARDAGPEYDVAVQQLHRRVEDVDPVAASAAGAPPFAVVVEDQVLCLVLVPLARQVELRRFQPVDVELRCVPIVLPRRDRVVGPGLDRGRRQRR